MKQTDKQKIYGFLKTYLHFNKEATCSNLYSACNEINLGINGGVPMNELKSILRYCISGNRPTLFKNLRVKEGKYGKLIYYLEK